MRIQPYSRKKRQLKFLLKQLKPFLDQSSHSIHRKMEQLKIKIRAIVKQLSKVLPGNQLKRIVGASAFALGISFTSSLDAQSFSSPVTNPFGLEVDINSYIAVPTIADLDGDGDLDVLIGVYEEYNYGVHKYYENTGTATEPAFGAPVENPFGLSSSLVYFNAPNFVDIDGDGDQDILSGGYLNGGTTVNFIENIGTLTAPMFGDVQESPFNLADSTDVILPEFVDLDGDGDYDYMAILYDNDFSFVYRENIGSSTEPQFGEAMPIPFGFEPPSQEFAIDFSFADIDEDGDLDLFLSSYQEYNEYFGVMYYYENVGDAQNPQFGEPQLNPFGLEQLAYIMINDFADLDGDGDMDILLNGYDNYSKIDNIVFQFVENDDLSSVNNPTRNDFEVTLFPNPTTDIVQISTKEQIERIELFNVLGQSVLETENKDRSVSLKDFTKGVYYMKITSRQGEVSIRQVHKL